MVPVQQLHFTRTHKRREFGSMDLLARAMRLRMEEEPDPEYMWEHNSQRATSNWEKCTKKLLLIMISARMQMSADSILGHANRQSIPEDLPTTTSRVREGGSGTTHGKSAMERPHTIPGIQWTRGRRLADSKMKGTKTHHPDNCTHPVGQMVNGGGAGSVEKGTKYWMTCKQCHGRWERVPVLPMMRNRSMNGQGQTNQEVRATPDMMHNSEEVIMGSIPYCSEHNLPMSLRRNSTDGGLFYSCALWPTCDKVHAVLEGGDRAVSGIG